MVSPISAATDRRLAAVAVSALIACVAAVALCYFFVDRPVAFYIHDRGINKIAIFKGLTLPPPIVQNWAPLAISLLIAARAWRLWERWQVTLFAACVSLIVADQFRTSLGEVCQRDWPETWHDNNPSLIGTGAYGFHLFALGDDVGSFPSGHAARIAGFFSVMWIGLPRGRALYAIIAVPMLVSLVAMNYHFVSDVIAGSMLGAIVGMYAAAIAMPECVTESPKM